MSTVINFFISLKAHCYFFKNGNISLTQYDFKIAKFIICEMFQTKNYSRLERAVKSSELSSDMSFVEYFEAWSCFVNE